jgi:hypothetical protein
LPAACLVPGLATTPAHLRSKALDIGETEQTTPGDFDGLKPPALD